MAVVTDGAISYIKLPGNGGTYEIKDTTARDLISGGVSFIVCTNKDTTPMGVQWKSGNTLIVGTLKASAATKGAFYLVPADEPYVEDSSDSTGDQSHFDEYVAAKVGSTYMWERLGRKDIDLTNYLTITSAASTYLKKGTDEATGTHTYSYNGEALKVTGTSGQVTVSGSSGKIAVTGTSGSIAVSGSSGSVVVGSSNAKTTVNKSSVKVQADATQNVTVGTTKVTITGCGSVTSEWNKDELKFTPATAGQTMEVKSDGTIVKKTGTNGATTNTYSFKGDFSSNDNAVVRKSDLADWGGSNKYVKKAGDTMTGALTNSYAGDAINVTGSNGAVVVGTGSAKTTVNSSSMKVQSDDTQNVTVGTGSVTVTGCNYVTSKLEKDKLTFGEQDGSATMSSAPKLVLSSSQVTYGFNGCGVYTFIGSSCGSVSMMADTDIIRKGELVDYVGSQGPYLAKNSDDSSTGKYTFSASDADAIKLSGANGGINVKGSSGKIVVGPASTNNEKSVQLTKSSLTFQGGTNNTAALKIEDGGTVTRSTNGIYTFSACATGTAISNLTDTDIIRKKDLTTYISSGDTYVKKAGDTMSGNLTFTDSGEGVVLRGGSGNASYGGAITAAYSSGKLTTKIVSTGGTGNPATTYEFPTNSGGDSTFAGSGATNTTVMRKGDLKALAFKSSVTVPVEGNTVAATVVLASGTTPALTLSVDANEILEIGWSAGAMPTFAPISVLSGASPIACTLND